MDTHCSLSGRSICFRPTQQDTPATDHILFIDTTLTVANRPRLNSTGKRIVENTKMNTGSSHLSRTALPCGWLLPEHVPIARHAGPPRLERSTEDDLISDWLYGVCYSSCPSEEPGSAGQSTPTVSLDSEGKAEVSSTITCPKIVLQPTRRNRSTARSGTGLDGPQSSESDELSKVLREGLGDLRELSRSADPSIGSQKLKSNTSGSIDWEKNWEKRKPRHKHDVSEASNSRIASHAHGAGLFLLASGDNGSDSSSDSTDVLDDKSCPYLSQHDSQFHAIQKYGVNSCPELHRQLGDFDKSLSGLKIRDDQEEIKQLRSELEKVRHRYHFHVRDLVTRRFRSLRLRLRRSGSSTFSVRSDFPAPPRAKERRLLARESVDAWPSSGEGTPLFNTPESNIAKHNSPHAPGHHFDPLAIASMMIATAELDRLSSRANLDQTSRTSGSSTSFSGSSPISRTPLYSGIGSPDNETTTSESPALYMPPTMPYNTPASSGPQSGVVSPVSRPLKRHGHTRRAHRSHLSEVTTPDDIASPEDSAEEFMESRPFLSSSQIETPPECSATTNTGLEDTLYPKPLAINRNDREETGPPDDEILGETREDLCSRSTISSPRPATSMEEPDISSQLSSDLDSNRAETMSAPAQVSSIGKTHESMYSPEALFRNGSASLPITPSILISDEDMNLNSCHPDMWSEAQGEPGDSDPFCPSDCLRTRHCSLAIDLRPSGPTR
ncbi:hypothetical protein F4804DRAFT_334580 [Jackrogersella minutella]|nr:hypothetical protein F4804DRAFT_334580 [Jackrogersella minutella]